MIKLFTVFYFLFFTSSIIFSQSNDGMLLDRDWKFFRGGAFGAQSPDFNDAAWKSIDLPHDWSIEDLPGTNSLFDSNAVSQIGGGFTTGGTGWYRKKFTVNKTDLGKAIYLQFDGVYMNAGVWINGEYLGNHPYGYTEFGYYISDKLKFNKENIVAVEVKNEGQNSRWYSGSGIYRHVWLKIAEPVHISFSGNSVIASDISETSAKINLVIGINNAGRQSSSVTLETKILNEKGIEVSRQNNTNNVSVSNSVDIKQNIILKNPQLWSTENPVLYTAIADLYQDDKLLSEEKIKFGIRTISFDATNGFSLNGKTVKLKGACFHNDNGPLGSKSYDRAEQRKVELLKASGFNAIRCSHNPPSPAFLDACDSLGMLVMDEAFDAWNEPKTPFDYHLYFNKWWQKDVRSMVLRDRNHPSIILWSIGNEIPERETAQGDTIAFMLARYIHDLDSTRPVTSAFNGVSEKADPFFDALGVAGYNYNLNKYVTDHKRKPNRIMVCTESYPLEAFEYWMGVTDHSWVIGDFVWTGFDYIGEASIGWRGYPQEKNFYPWNLAFCGDIDICGWKRPQSFYRDVLWKDKQLSIFVKPPQPSFEPNPKREEWSKWHWHDVVGDWNWKGYENKPFDVVVYSSCPQVELFLNGKSLGRQSTNRSTKFTATWQVPYQPGILKAIGYDRKKQINSLELHSADEPVQIKLTADRHNIKANNEDLSYINVELTDNNGYRNPKAENLIQFEIEGEGTIVGVGNANPISLESYQQPHRKAWQGRCMVIIKSGSKPGRILLKASSEGLKPAEISVNTD